MHANHYSRPELTEQDFQWIKAYLYKQAGIVLGHSKHAMVVGRLDRRLRHLGVSSYREYFKLFTTPGFEQEPKIAIDLLTTNETYFFREHRHFEFLISQILTKQRSSRPFRAWSAASSSGEEAYTLAMLFSEYRRFGGWEIFATDISSTMLKKASMGLYPIEAAEKIPGPLLKKYCLKGTGEYEGYLLVDPKLKEKVKFLYANLAGDLPNIGLFDVIFLRNVMIYFDNVIKQRLISEVEKRLHPGGYLFISHSETLSGLETSLHSVAPSVYHKNDV